MAPFLPSPLALSLSPLIRPVRLLRTMTLPSFPPSMDGKGDSGVAEDGGSGGDNNRSGRGQIPGRQTDRTDRSRLFASERKQGS